MTTSIKELKEIISKLRHPKDGCPWDLSQTHQSLTPYVIEEAYEVVDAISMKNDENLIEELGDLLFQILLHAEIAEEEKRFSLDDIINHLKEKIVRRHPHVFKKRIEQKVSIEEVKNIWESIKKEEQKKLCPNFTSKHPVSDKLSKIIRSQPPIKGTIEISKKVSAEGFGWDSVNRIWEKVYEEINELKEALELKDAAKAEAELGDVFFSLIISLRNHCE